MFYLKNALKHITENIVAFIFIVGICCSSCKKFVEVDPPATALAGSSVYQDDNTAAGVMTGLYSLMSSNSRLITGSGSIALKTGLSSDELTLWSSSSSIALQQLYQNKLTTDQDLFIWRDLYTYIYTVNTFLENLSPATKLTPSVKKQLEGEAKFLRAFFYFYLVNLYGDVPLQTSSDWRVNSIISRSPASKVYEQIMSDLKEAKNLLSESFLNGNLLNYSGTPDRVRPTKWAASALLSRVYLYGKNWAEAESEANTVLGNISVFDTVSLNNVFLKNSKESIWQLQPVNSNSNTNDGATFILTSSGPTNLQPVYLSNNLLNTFEVNDQRKVNWTKTVSVGTVNYTYPFKYKLGASTTPGSEYLMMLRVGELYLIRAEARAMQGKFSESQNDVNIIRKRAGLLNTSAADQSSLINVIAHERQVELFTEWGHRWLDLKRLGIIDTVMVPVTSSKGGQWKTEWQLYPILNSDILLNPRLSQNLGY